MAEKRIYTIAEVEEMLCISRPTAYNLLKKNLFSWNKLEGKYIISKISFDEWLDQQHKKAVSSTENSELKDLGVL